jgi:streptogramin lyase
MFRSVGAGFPRLIRVLATAAIAATAIVVNTAPAHAATVITEFPIPTVGSTPQGIAVGLDGNLWFTEFAGGSKIGRITPTGTITEFPGLSSAPFWITSGPDGNLWFTETGAYKIGTMSTLGAVLGEFQTPTAGSVPDQIAPGPDGNLWFTEYSGNRIAKISPAGLITEFPVLPAGAGPTAIVTGADANLWFTEQAAGKIGTITTGGTVTEFGSGLATPAGIAAGPDGNLWFTEYDGNRIGRVTTTGTVTEFAVTTPGSHPASITAGPDGNLWFTEESAGKIGWMSPAGTMLGEFDVPTPNSGPGAIVAGPDRNLWFPERMTNQVGRLTPAGLTAATALTYTGAATGDFNDPATVSATLVNSSVSPATPLSGQSVVFTLNGADTCTGLTDAQGLATCQLTPIEPSGSYPLIASFAGSSLLSASTASTSFAVTAEQSALALAWSQVDNALSVTATLTEDGTRPLAGRTVTLGSGPGAKTCTATTNAAGSATCVIDAGSQSGGTGAVFATFAGDAFYAPASITKSQDSGPGGGSGSSGTPPAPITAPAAPTKAPAPPTKAPASSGPGDNHQSGQQHGSLRFMIRF